MLDRYLESQCAVEADRPTVQCPRSDRTAPTSFAEAVVEERTIIEPNIWPLANEIEKNTKQIYIYRSRITNRLIFGRLSCATSQRTANWRLKILKFDSNETNQLNRLNITSGRALGYLNLLIKHKWNNNEICYRSEWRWGHVRRIATSWRRRQWHRA